jgi:NADH pyrophosphatase NudC (nudix superfamily)
MRPIDADDLVQKIYEHAWVADNIFIDELVDGIIGNMETIEERPRGKWIKHEKSISTGFRHLRECSCCKCYFDWLMPRNSFCPNCGADMRGEDKE